MKRLKYGVSLAFLGFWGLCANAQVSVDKIKRLIAETKSDNEQLAQVATMELAGVGEEGISAFEKQLPAAGDRDWETYLELVGKARKSTRVTIHGEQKKANEVMKEIAGQSGLVIIGASTAVDAQLARQEINLGAEGVCCWDILESICRPANLAPTLRPTGEIALQSQKLSPRSLKIAGDWILLNSIDWDQNVDYQNRSGSITTVKLQFLVFPDPSRMGLFTKGEFRIDKATDDQGNAYVQNAPSNATIIEFSAGRAGAPPARGGAAPNPANRIRLVPMYMNHGDSATITARGTPGNKLTVRGAAILYGSAAETKKLELDKLTTQSLDFGGCKLLVEKGEEANQPTIKITAREEDWKMNTDEPFLQVVQMMLQNCVWLEDDQGARQLMRTSSMSSGGRQTTATLRMAPASPTARPFGKPSKAIVVFPKDLKPISIPFEFKDIPLP